MPVVLRRPGGTPIPDLHVYHKDSSKNLEVHGSQSAFFPEIGENIYVTLHREDGSWKHCTLKVTSRVNSPEDPEDPKDIDPRCEEYRHLLGTGDLNPVGDALLELPICCPRCHAGNDPLDRQCYYCHGLLS